MNQFLNTGIKEVIQSFPEVGAILEQYDIGCVTCGAGTCLLKDVVHIHGLTRVEEASLMARIEKAIYPEREIPLPVVPIETNQNEPVKLKYSPPIKKLVEEHGRIKRLLAFIPAICDHIANEKLDHQLVNDCIYFVRNYADKFHHAKEEDILFHYVDETQDIIRVMLQDHQSGRSFIRSAAAGLEAHNAGLVIKSLTEYRDLLQQHIKKEDEILYPWIDRTLTTRQVGELASRFNEVRHDFGMDIEGSFMEFLKTLEVKF